jgi:hypothetical protein
MREFRVVVDPVIQRKSGWKIRLAIWGTIPAFLGAAVFALDGALSSKPNIYRVFTIVAILIVNAAIVTAYYLAARLGMDKLRKESVFVLTDYDLTRRRAGWPDIKIRLDEIKAIRERKGWLLVESSDSSRRIAIPTSVDGFPYLRDALAKHSATTRRA